MIRIVRIILFFLLISSSFSFGQNEIKQDTILLVIKDYCTDNLQKDTLTIKIGMKSKYGYYYSYLKINKEERQFRIQYLTEEIHFKEKETIKTYSKDDEYLIERAELLFSLETELLNCKYGKNKKDDRWNYEVVNTEIPNHPFVDVFGHSIYAFFKRDTEEEQERPLKDYFCKTDLKFTQRTEIIESYYDKEIKRDTVITQEIVCKNGDVAYRTIKDTKKNAKEYNQLSFNTTMNSSSRMVTIGYSYNRAAPSYNQTIFSKKSAYSIDYDSVWNMKELRYFKNFKKGNKSLINAIHVNSKRSKEKVNFKQYQILEFLGLIRKVKIYDVDTGKYKLDEKRRKIFNVEKYFNYESDGQKRLQSKTSYHKNKKIKKDYNSGGVVGSTFITTWNKLNQITEYQNFEYDKLVEKSTFIYQVETGIEAEARLQKFFNETTD